MQHHSCAVSVASHLFPASKRKNRKKKRKQIETQTKGPLVPTGLCLLRLGTVCPASLVHGLGGLTGVFAAKTTSVDAVDVNCAKNATSTRLPVNNQEILHGSCRLIRAPGTMSLVQGLADLTCSDLMTL